MNKTHEKVKARLKQILVPQLTELYKELRADPVLDFVVSDKPEAGYNSHRIVSEAMRDALEEVVDDMELNHR